MHHLVHLWLCEGGFINFIVPESAIANKINNNIKMESLAPLSCKLTDPDNCFQIITIYMEYRGIQSFSHICAVLGRSSSSWIGCEGNLVVNNNMYGSTSCVVGKGT